MTDGRQQPGCREPKMTEKLTDEERARYEWQMWTPDIGEAAQEKLKSASVLVSRVGGVGGTVAYYLAAAGIGRLVLAHAGDVKPSDLNRQLLMTTDHLGKLRVESARRRLQELNPNVTVDVVPENVNTDNAKGLVESVDLVIDAAPLFEERFAMNDAAFELGRPLIEAAMYDFDAQLMMFVPGETACLRCLFPTQPPEWKRQFPVFGAVSGTIASLAVVEAIKLITGLKTSLAGKILRTNMRTMNFRTIPIQQDPTCPCCNQTASQNS